MEKLSTFIAHAREELYKVIFPTKVQVRQAFLAVILVVTVISIFLALIDLLMSSIISTI
ncbi:Preprotein translocase subunit SecE (TC 3.A.5.1.1) [hydrothermal vent metagenome]|uniref:Preprotein translocase subunit SecE (TC 3.A.5.1.1) n=1 Tax=hydrothermal vent metagenome TaxID=652676 RepID=A0A1W1BVI3_9ZZZZ